MKNKVEVNQSSSAQNLKHYIHHVYVTEAPKSTMNLWFQACHVAYTRPLPSKDTTLNTSLSLILCCITLIKIEKYIPVRLLRSKSYSPLRVQKIHTSMYGENSFRVLAPRLWIKLPNHIKLATSKYIFCKTLKTHLF